LMITNAALVLVWHSGMLPTKMFVELSAAVFPMLSVIAACPILSMMCFVCRLSPDPDEQPQVRDNTAAMRRDIERTCPSKTSATAVCLGRGVETCVVCLETKMPAQPCRMLECGHEFHTGCIDDWWRTRKNLICPVCRAPVDVAQPSEEVFAIEIP